MCVAALAWNAHPRWPLVMIGNRDELHERESAPLARWADRYRDEDNGIIAGRDLVAGGTWLGVHEAGRFALVTNYRVPEGPQPGRLSRGTLVTDCLTGKQPGEIARMNAFNLVHVTGGIGGEARFLTNHPCPRHVALQRGIHGLSNGGFDDLWPKTAALKGGLRAWLEGLEDGGEDGDDLEPLFRLLRSDTPLPAVGDIGPDPDFSSVFIDNPHYGTRCSTVLTIDNAGLGRIVERCFDAQARQTGETAIDFRWP